MIYIKNIIITLKIINQIKSYQIKMKYLYLKYIWTTLYNEKIKPITLKLMINWSYIQDIYSNIYK